MASDEAKDAASGEALGSDGEGRRGRAPVEMAAPPKVRHRREGEVDEGGGAARAPAEESSRRSRRTQASAHAFYCGACLSTGDFLFCSVYSAADAFKTRRPLTPNDMRCSPCCQRALQGANCPRPANLVRA